MALHDIAFSVFLLPSKKEVAKEKKKEFQVRRCKLKKISHA
jgi:hypothetical protein